MVEIYHRNVGFDWNSFQNNGTTIRFILYLTYLTGWCSEAQDSSKHNSNKTMQYFYNFGLNHNWTCQILFCCLEYIFLLFSIRNFRPSGIQVGLIKKIAIYNLLVTTLPQVAYITPTSCDFTFFDSILLLCSKVI